MDIIGHNKQLEYLQSVQSNGTLAHAYVFTGPTSVGKLAIGRQLACELLQVLAPEQSANFRSVEPITDKKTGQPKNSISIEQIRQAASVARSGGLQSGKNVLIVDDAHLMTRAAQNALLKTLEEPVPGSHIFLVTHDADRLLPTIRSRSTVLHFGLVPHTSLPSAMQSFVQDQSPIVKKVLHGRPGMITRFMQEDHAMMQSQLEDIQAVLDALPYERCNLAEKYAKRSVRELLLLIDLYALADRSKAAQAIRAKELLQKNVNKTLALEYAFL